MSSKILSSIGLGNMDLAIPFLILFGLFLIVVVFNIVLLCKQSKLTKKYNQFMSGKNGESLEEEFRRIFEDVHVLKEVSDQNKSDIQKLYQLQSKNIQKIGMKKYDAFQQMGGQLSFCFALLDEYNNGILLNSVHSTDGCYSYIKEIKQGECKLPLGDEEVETLQMAMESMK